VNKIFSYSTLHLKKLYAKINHYMVHYMEDFFPIIHNEKTFCMIGYLNTQKLVVLEGKNDY